jgi:rod shape determining protein RodA
MTMIFCHIFINIAMTIGLVPITGIPLPFISYGGTFMISTMSALGMVQSVHIRGDWK